MTFPALAGRPPILGHILVIAVHKASVGTISISLLRSKLHTEALLIPDAGMEVMWLLLNTGIPRIAPSTNNHVVTPNLTYKLAFNYLLGMSLCAAEKENSQVE